MSIERLVKMDVKLSANGRICIPADVREHFGLKDGDVLSLEVSELGILLQTRRQKIKAVQQWFAELTKGQPEYTVDDFLRDKRDEVRREEEKHRMIHGE